MSVHMSMYTHVLHMPMPMSIRKCRLGSRWVHNSPRKHAYTHVCPHAHTHVYTHMPLHMLAHAPCARLLSMPRRPPVVGSVGHGYLGLYTHVAHSQRSNMAPPGSIPMPVSAHACVHLCARVDGHACMPCAQVKMAVSAGSVQVKLTMPRRAGQKVCTYAYTDEYAITNML